MHPRFCPQQHPMKLWHYALSLVGGVALATSLTITPPGDLHPSDLRFVQGTAPAEGVTAPAPRPVRVVKRRVGGISFYQTTIDLTDPYTFVTIALANNATQANSSQETSGSESFKALAKRQRAAVVASGTFFSMDAQQRVMGNLVAEGRFLKYSPWENYGTTLGIRAGNRVEMVTARIEGTPSWDQHWFSLTAGPRLLNQGRVWLAPKSEGFRDPRVMGVAERAAIGYPRGGKKLVLVTFISRVSLPQAAKLMRTIGCYEAMNLDGGSSLALAKSGKVLLPAARRLTNVIVVYDTNHPAPQRVRETWHRFQNGERPVLPVDTAFQ